MDNCLIHFPVFMYRLRLVILVCLWCHLAPVYSQDSLSFSLKVIEESPPFSVDINTTSSSWDFQMPFDYLSQSPSKETKKVCRKYNYLLHKEPDSLNDQRYSQLIYALWAEDRLEEAEKLCLKVIHSSDPYYIGIHYYSAGIIGDTTIRAYGSFTADHRNDAAIILTKICLKQKKFKEAYQYLEDAIKKYPVSYTCGTYFWMQKNEYDFLYASCYEGLSQYKQVLELLLPECLNRHDEISVRVIKKLFTPKAIADSLQKAEQSMQFFLDTLPSYFYSTHFATSDNAERTDTIIFYSGVATMTLFGTSIQLDASGIKNGEHATREYFIRKFRKSSFYDELDSE
ncbi:hypothetical protein [Xanthocytophaga agilis]|nr:hypothetical protein [Xanthocytophaga agilis]